MQRKPDSNPGEAHEKKIVSKPEDKRIKVGPTSVIVEGKASFKMKGSFTKKTNLNIFGISIIDSAATPDPILPSSDLATEYKFNSSNALISKVIATAPAAPSLEISPPAAKKSELADPSEMDKPVSQKDLIITVSGTNPSLIIEGDLVAEEGVSINVIDSQRSRRC